MAKKVKAKKEEEKPFVPIPAPVDYMDELLKKEGRENEIPK